MALQAGHSCQAVLEPERGFAHYLYDVFRFILGAEVTRVSAFFDQPTGRLEKLALALFAFDSGVLLQINTNETTIPSQSVIESRSRLGAE